MNITSINHACLLIESGDQFILTDPWPLSPAFGGWTQQPRPSCKDIKKIIDIPSDKLTVVISHGHDDHFDDYFCKKYLYDSTVVIPKHDHPGFKNRAARSFKKVIEVDESGEKVGDSTFRSFINSEYTNHDAIVTIELEKDVIIHANDNWHQQEKKHLDIIKELCVNKRSHYYCQIGIADCFPSSYEMIADEDKIKIVKKRLKEQIESVKKNFTYVNAEKLFCYANQSQITASTINPYEILQGLLREESLITQVVPSEGTDYLSSLIQEQQDTVNSYLQQDLQVKFYIGVPKEKPKQDEVFYCADSLVWQRIFNGQLNLECLGIGGMGSIIVNPNTNIREAHYFLSNYAYRLQHEINSSHRKIL